MLKIEDILNLERIDDDIYRGQAIESRRQRTFGGQVAGQALVAATRTVDPDKPVHSLHGYFLRAGNPTEPTVYRVERLRDGRSFTTRSVQAIQHGQVLFSMQASFHIRNDEGPVHSDRMREVPHPDEVGINTASGVYGDPELMNEWGEWDIRLVDPADYEHNQYTASQQVVWLRSRKELPDDDTFHVCALAYMSDMTLLLSSMVPHPGHKVQMASLDHAMWFLRPFRVDEWLLYDQVSPSAAGARGLTTGRIFNQSGHLVAMVTQEGLIRTLRQ